MGIQTYRNDLRILFLIFANDYILFAKASNKARSIINSILHDFCDMLGQLVNFYKFSNQM